jgi:hypothetical protein
VQDDEHDGRNRYCQDDERQDEKRGLFARFLGWLRDPERADEGVGEKVYETHGSIMLRSGRKRNFESSMEFLHLYR